MMYKKNILIILSSIVLAVLVSGCFDDRENLFEESQLEWEPPNPANNSLSATVELDEDQTENETVILRMRYAGEHLADAFTGIFEIDSEAVEGEHYDVSSYSVEVPAYSSFSEEIEIEIYADAFANGEEIEMFLVITDESDVEPMANYRDFVLTVEKADE